MANDYLLVPESTEPAANCARVLVDRHNCIPPVSIETLASQYASVEEAPWPTSSCDGLVVGLGDEKPRIFLREGSAPRRKRFTLAHELGHVVLGWHAGILGCSPLQPTESSASHAKSRLARIMASKNERAQEDEATKFASLVLLPDRWLRPLLLESSLPETLRALDNSNVSTWACAIRLASMLQPGFVFRFNDGYSTRVLPSPGTRHEDRTNLRAFVLASGKQSVSGNVLEWFQFNSPHQHVSDSDPRTTTQVLRASIAASVADPEERTRVEQGINGVVGSALSSHGSASVDQTLSILYYRCRSSSYAFLLEAPDFAIYLSRKVEAWVQRRSRGSSSP